MAFREEMGLSVDLAVGTRSGDTGVGGGVELTLSAGTRPGGRWGRGGADPRRGAQPGGHWGQEWDGADPQCGRLALLTHRWHRNYVRSWENQHRTKKPWRLGEAVSVTD